MPYDIVNSDGTTVVPALADMTVDTTSTSLTLIGRAYANYGQSLNNNLVALMENFSSAVMPNKPLLGQLWYNKSVGIISIYDGVGATGYEPLATRSWVSTQINNIPIATPVNTSTFVGKNQNPITLSGDVTGTMGDSKSAYDIAVSLPEISIAGIYGGSLGIPVITLNRKGQVTAVSVVTPGNTAAAAVPITVSGDVVSTTSTPSGSLPLTLNTTITNPGTYGANVATGSYAPWFSVTSKGIINSVGQTLITPASIGAAPVDSSGNLLVKGSIGVGLQAGTTSAEINFNTFGTGAPAKIYYSGGAVGIANNGKTFTVDGGGSATVSGNIICFGGTMELLGNASGTPAGTVYFGTAPTASSPTSTLISGNPGALIFRVNNPTTTKQMVLDASANLSMDGSLSAIGNIASTGGAIQLGYGSFGQITFGDPTANSNRPAAISLNSGILYLRNDDNTAGAIAYNAGSDRRIKKNIVPFDDGLVIVKSLEVVNFEYRANSDYADGKTHTGFIAQQIQPHVPDAVMGTDILHVSKQEVVPYLTRAVQQLSEMNDMIMVQYGEVKAQNANLTARVEALEAKLKD